MNQALYYIVTPFLISITLFGLIQMYLKETYGEALNTGIQSTHSIFRINFNLKKLSLLPACFFFMKTQYNHGAQLNTPKHVVRADDVSIWAEPNNGKKNAEASLAAIHVAGTELKGNTKTMSVSSE